MDRRGMSSRRARRDSGASAVEYGLIIAGAGVVLVALSFATGKAVSGAFLTNATAIGGTPGVVGAADVGGVVDPTTGTVAPTTTSAAPTTTSAAPTTTSAAPVTTSAAPVTTSAAPTTTSASPTTTSASPTPSGTALPQGNAWTEDYNPPKGYGYDSCTRTPSSAGVCGYSSKGQDKLTYTSFGNAPIGTVVTVTWTLTDSSRNPGPDIVITRTFVITA